MILLSFDTEEFDVPREHGVEYNTLKEGMEVSVYGTQRILDILKKTGVKATFFCTANFAKNSPETMRRIIEEGHEVAAHGCDHWNPKPSDVFESKEVIESLYGVKVEGYRQPRMFPVSDRDIKAAGYLYNSSLNPAFIPGRYMHFTSPRTPFWTEGVLQIPASVTPLFRIPLFWLSLHNFPFWLYKFLSNRVVNKDGHFATYFHPWEFFPLKEHPELKMPFIIKNNSGKDMEKRLSSLIEYFLNKNQEFITYSDFYRRKKQGND